MSHSGDNIFLLIGYLIIFVIVYSMSLSLIETIFAFVMGGIILLTIKHFLEGPRLEITYSKRQPESEKPLRYRHVFSIQNKGKTTGNVIDITVEPNEVKPSLIIDLDNNNKPMVARFNIDGKHIRNLAIDCSPSSIDTAYRIKIKYETSLLNIFNIIRIKEKIIWH